MEYEEDKEDIDLEIKRVKKLIFYLNSNESGLLNISNFSKVLQTDRELGEGK